MIQRFRGEKGFTLIELMIVIAIIGILAAIAIPNFIAYRDKAFCSQAESDANSISAGIADYFSIPTNVSLANLGPANPIVFPDPTAAPINLSRMGDPTANQGSVVSNAGPPITFTISVLDGSGRCPQSYQLSNPFAPPADPEGWDGAGTFNKIM